MNTRRSVTVFEAPFGPLTLVSDSGALLCVTFGEKEIMDARRKEDEVLIETKRQLTEYFEGHRRRFELPLSLRGTAFQRSVWKALQEIPYGEVRSYHQIALSIGSERSCRAVGNANGKNPIAIIIPCHRVIMSSGKLGGYSGQEGVKEFLLRGEREGFRGTVWNFMEEKKEK